MDVPIAKHIEALRTKNEMLESYEFADYEYFLTIFDKTWPDDPAMLELRGEVVRWQEQRTTWLRSFVELESNFKEYVYVCEKTAFDAQVHPLIIHANVVRFIPNALATPSDLDRNLIPRLQNQECSLRIYLMTRSRLIRMYEELVALIAWFNGQGKKWYNSMVTFFPLLEIRYLNAMHDCINPFLIKE